MGTSKNQCAIVHAYTHVLTEANTQRKQKCAQINVGIE